MKLGGAASLAAILATALVGCTAPSPAPPSPSPIPTVTTKTWPQMSGAEFDQALRSGNAQSGTFPKFGRLIASSQTGSPESIDVDLTGVNGKIIGIYACSGEGKAPEFDMSSEAKTFMYITSNGCNPALLYSAESPKIGKAGPVPLKIKVPNSIQYAFVLEEVA